MTIKILGTLRPFVTGACTANYRDPQICTKNPRKSWQVAAGRRMRWRVLAVLLAVGFLFACGGSGPQTPDAAGEIAADEPTDGLLEPVATEAQFVAAMSAAMEAPQQEARFAPGLPAELSLDAMNAAPEADTGSSGAGFSQTYTLETDVDEYDILKYDGRHLYIARNRAPICCYIDPLPLPVDVLPVDVLPVDVLPVDVLPVDVLPVEILPVEILHTETAEPDVPVAQIGVEENLRAAAVADIAPEYQPPTGVIRVLATDIAAATATELATIELPARGYVSGMYLHNGKLAALSTQNSFFPYGPHFFERYAWYQQQVNLDIYSVEDAANPEPRYKIEIEGGLVESRRIGNTVYLITRHTPNIFFPAVTKVRDATAPASILTDVAETAMDPAALTAEKLIPRVTINGVARELFQPTDCWVANSKKDAFERPGHAVLTSVTAIPLHAPGSMHTLCYNQSTAGIYVSQQAIYLSDIRYQSDETVIHKFALTDIKAEYRGSGRVPGHLWTGGQNDFRISEHNGLLRVVTTSFTGNADDRFEHRLFILEESVAETALDIVAQLPNELRPEPLGKPNEQLFGVRFFGERAYLVTFERIDPLYVLDLSDSRDPKILGELEVPGFSEFLHPVNDSLLLGLGQNGNGDWRLKLELFDVSDPLNPVSRSLQFVGEQGERSYSEAQYNRHAFTYLTLDASTDRFALPANINGTDNTGRYRYEHALQLFEVRGKDNPALAELAAVGALRPNPEPHAHSWWPENERAVLHDDAVFYISGGWVWSAPWTAPGQSAGPQ
ncbi:MAG: beta-propeller domain-containing protein [Pseudomonadales bacterium]